MQPTKDYIQNIENAERRFFTSPIVEIRADDPEKPATIEGYAALYNSPTLLGSGSWAWTEEIAPGAFDEVMQDDVRCLFNHNPDYPLARSNKGKGTLVLSLDSKGLKYKYETPNRSYALDLADAISKGDVSQSSFAFQVEEQRWEEFNDEDKPDKRILVKFKSLHDVSPVTYPAYADTTVAQRSLTAVKKENTHTTTQEENLRFEKEYLKQLQLKTQ